MQITTHNPYNGKELKKHEQLTGKKLETQLSNTEKAFNKWKLTALKERIEIIKKLGALLLEKKEKFARLMAQEMGKPVTEGIAEIEKCAWVCDYYAGQAPDFLADEIIKTEATKSYVRYAPLGTILAVMPWNYPFWQVFRFAVPTLLAGNTALLKHASNVLGSGNEIEKLFKQAGLPANVFVHIIADYKMLAIVVAHPSVKAVSLTGSEGAGASIASVAGKHLKKCVLELGGSNAVIVCADADVRSAVDVCIKARMQNAGQSCIAGKRFLIHDAVYDEFMGLYRNKISRMVIGDPLKPETEIGPLAKKELADDLQKQIKRSVKMGARVIYGGKAKGAMHEPTIMVDVTPGMPAFDEETFGPLSVCIKVKNLQEALAMAAQTDFGLGLTVCTTNADAVLAYQHLVPDGSLFINEKVSSDPRLPFGGTKKSGYGRELSRAGIHEFVNKQTVYVK